MAADITAALYHNPDFRVAFRVASCCIIVFLASFTTINIILEMPKNRVNALFLDFTVFFEIM